MCSKKCANPVCPGSYSSRAPVRTTDQYATSPFELIGTSTTLSPLSSVSIWVLYGKMFPVFSACTALPASMTPAARHDDQVLFTVFLLAIDRIRSPGEGWTDNR